MVVEDEDECCIRVELVRRSIPNSAILSASRAFHRVAPRSSSPAITVSVVCVLRSRGEKRHSIMLHRKSMYNRRKEEKGEKDPLINYRNVFNTAKINNVTGSVRYQDQSRSCKNSVPSPHD